MASGTIRDILRNQVYVGDFVWNKRREGRFYSIQGGKPSKRNRSEFKPPRPGTRPKRHRTAVFNSPEEWIVFENSHEGLIDRELFARVQERLSQRTKATSGHKKKNGDGYVLSGLVYCGHCGGKMHGTRGTRKKGGKTYVYHRYLCSTYAGHGSSQCNYNPMHQEPLVRVVLKKLRDAILAGGNKEALRERIIANLKARKSIAPQRVDSLRDRAAELDQLLERGSKRLLSADDALYEMLAAELSQARRERERLGRELEALEQAGRAKEDDIERRADAALDPG